MSPFVLLLIAFFWVSMFAFVRVVRLARSRVRDTASRKYTGWGLVLTGLSGHGLLVLLPLHRLPDTWAFGLRVGMLMLLWMAIFAGIALLERADRSLPRRDLH